MPGRGGPGRDGPGRAVPGRAGAGRAGAGRGGTGRGGPCRAGAGRAGANADADADADAVGVPFRRWTLCAAWSVGTEESERSRRLGAERVVRRGQGGIRRRFGVGVGVGLFSAITSRPTGPPNPSHHSQRTWARSARSPRVQQAHPTRATVHSEVGPLSDVDRPQTGPPAPSAGGRPAPQRGAGSARSPRCRRTTLRSSTAPRAGAPPTPAPHRHRCPQRPGSPPTTPRTAAPAPTPAPPPRPGARAPSRQGPSQRAPRSPRSPRASQGHRASRPARCRRTRAARSRSPSPRQTSAAPPATGPAA